MPVCSGNFSTELNIFLQYALCLGGSLPALAIWQRLFCILCQKDRRGCRRHPGNTEYVDDVKTTEIGQKRKFTKQVLVRALEAKPGWIGISFLQETAQTIRLNHRFSFFYIFICSATQSAELFIKVPFPCYVMICYDMIRYDHLL